MSITLAGFVTCNTHDWHTALRPNRRTKQNRVKCLKDTTETPELESSVSWPLGHNASTDILRGDNVSSVWDVLISSAGDSVGFIVRGRGALAPVCFRQSINVIFNKPVYHHVLVSRNVVIFRVQCILLERVRGERIRAWRLITLEIETRHSLFRINRYVSRENVGLLRERQ